MATTPREIKVAREQAEAEFDGWLEDMDIVLGKAKEDSEDRERMLRAIMTGDLTFNDSGEAVYTPWRSKSKPKDPITFHERTGADLMAADGHNGKAKGLVRQTYAMMGSLCGVDASTFAGLSGSDIKTCEAIFSLLMA